MSTNEIYGFLFHALFFWFGQCLCDALIPLGYDSDLQRICIIKLVERFMSYTSMGVFFLLAQCSFIEVNKTILLCDITDSAT